MSIPQLSPEQLQAARAAAAGARRARAELKGQVRDGRLGLGAALFGMWRERVSTPKAGPAAAKPPIKNITPGE